MISCKRATELISKSMDEPLSLKETLGLKIHLFICEFCEKFAQQLTMIKKALGQVASEDTSSCEIPADAKEKLKNKLNNSQKN